jgi:glycosyltransferase involved in cell wall biosynthesis
MKDFSIVMPTRGEKENVKKMLDAFEATTSRKDAIEILFAIDEGKTEIRDFVQGQGYNYDIYFYERPKTRNFSEDYYNWLSNRSCGRNIWGFNDDAWLMTNGWDDIIRKKIKQSGMTVYLVDTHDSTKKTPANYFCTFPIISRKAKGALGYFLHPRIRMYPADKVLFDIFSTVKKVIDANEVKIQHDHIGEMDPSKSMMIEIFNEDKMLWSKDPLDVRNEIIRLLSEGEKDRKPSKIKRIINILQED